MLFHMIPNFLKTGVSDISILWWNKEIKMRSLFIMVTNF